MNPILFLKKCEREFERLVQWYGLVILQLGLSVIYIWFGALKLFNYDPTTPIQRVAFSNAIDLSTFAPIIGVLEVVTGLALLLPIVRLPRWLENTSVRVALALLAFQLLATVAIALVYPSRLFAPHFPYVSVAGELLFRNLVFALSGLVVAGHLRMSSSGSTSAAKTDI